MLSNLISIRLNSTHNKIGMNKLITKCTLRHVAKYTQSVQQLSTATQPNRIQSFRTNIDQPSKHSPESSAQFYTVPANVRGQLFRYGGFPKSFEIQTKTFCESCLMVREPMLDLLNCLEGIDFSKPAVRFVVYGEKGVGKSLVLAHALHYALEKEFLIVHVPWVGQWMRRCKESSNSETKEGYIDINLDAAAWLVHFKHQNAHILQQEQLVTSHDVVWNKREITPANTQLSVLVDHGINRVKYASDCAVILCKEIKRLATEGKCKVFVAIDGYNALFYPNTRVYTEKKEVVPPSKVSLTEGFLELTKFDWNNGVCVLTADELAIAEKDQISHLPRYLLGKDGFEFVDPFIPIHVPIYSEKEFGSCMDYYRDRKWILPVHGQDDELGFLSRKNPFKLMELCKGL